MSAVLTSGQRSVTFTILASTPMFGNHRRVTVTIDTCVRRTNTPTPIIGSATGLVSLGCTPFSLTCTSFSTSRCLHSLAVPLLIGCNTCSATVPVRRNTRHVVSTTHDTNGRGIAIQCFINGRRVQTNGKLFALGLPLTRKCARTLRG